MQASSKSIIEFTAKTSVIIGFTDKNILSWEKFLVHFEFRGNFFMENSFPGNFFPRKFHAKVISQTWIVLVENLLTFLIN
jgi:hypothetical protein